MLDKLKEDLREAITGSTPENDLRARLHDRHAAGAFFAQQVATLRMCGDETASDFGSRAAAADQGRGACRQNGSALDARGHCATLPHSRS